MRMITATMLAMLLLGTGARADAIEWRNLKYEDETLAVPNGIFFSNNRRACVKLRSVRSCLKTLALLELRTILFRNKEEAREVRESALKFEQVWLKMNATGIKISKGGRQ